MNVVRTNKWLGSLTHQILFDQRVQNCCPAFGCKFGICVKKLLSYMYVVGVASVYF
jgi:hypothetical protein